MLRYRSLVVSLRALNERRSAMYSLHCVHRIEYGAIIRILMVVFPVDFFLDLGSLDGS